MKWIVIDFGTYRIKALRLRMDGQKLVFEDFRTFESKPEYFRGLGFPDHPAWAALTINFNEWDWLRPDEDLVVTSALPSAYLESRYLRFPFRSMKQIEKVLPFELESAIPFDIEEIQIRSQLIEGPGVQTTLKDALVLTMGYRRDHIQAFEGEMKKFQPSTPPFTAQSLTLATLRQAITEEPLFGILELGHSKSQLVLVRKTGEILGVRTFWWGGSSMIKAIADEMNLDSLKAEQVLRSLPRNQALPPSVEASISQFGTELRQTFKSWFASGLELPSPFPIYAFGGALQVPSLLERIPESFKQDFTVQVRSYPFERLATNQIQGLASIENPVEALQAISIALLQTRTHRNRVPTFSETTFQFQQNLKRLRTGSFSLLKQAAALMIFPLIFLIASVFVQSRENKVLLSELDRLLRESGLKIEVQNSTDEIITVLQQEVVQNRKRIASMQDDQESPLSILTSLSKSIPSHLKIDVKEFSVTTSLVSLIAETDTLNTADEIFKSVKAIYPAVKEGSPVDCPGGKKNCFRISMEVSRESKPAEKKKP